MSSPHVKAKIGIYNLHMQTRGGGEKLTLALAEHLSSKHDVSLFHEGPLDIPSLEHAFAVDLSRVRFIRLQSLELPLRAVARLRGDRLPAFSLHHYLELKRLNLDLFINASYASSVRCPATKGVFLCMFPHDPGPQHNGAGMLGRARAGVATSIENTLARSNSTSWLTTYSQVVAISGYSADWVKRLWERDAEIVYPPCDDMGPPSDKEKIILHVGRFAAPNAERERHHKDQETLLSVFQEMKSEHQRGWELHFAGRIHPDDASAQFADTLVRNAQGLPVKFHFNSSLAELRELYRRTAIYWHATGFGFQANDYPAKQEHFGITTVEAMSAGAVPVVKCSGGQPEIVTHGIDGLYWDDLPGLVDQTVTLIGEPDRLRCLSEQAILSSRKFRREVFAAGMDRVIDSLVG